MFSGFEGFIGAERFASLNEKRKLLFMNVQTDEAIAEGWRNVMDRRKAEIICLNHIRITICSVIREYWDKERDEAPVDSNVYFY